MKRYGFLVSAMAVVALVFASLNVSSAGAEPEIRNYGPYHDGTSPDSGTCGNTWATDTFNRFFRVFTTPSAPGTYTVIEEFRAGSFVTNDGPSPGACDPDNPLGGTVAEGITGKMSGTLTIIVSNGLYDPDANPGPNSTTSTFISAVFGSDAVIDTPVFSFRYFTPQNGSWINASTGNSGDITGTP